MFIQSALFQSEFILGLSSLPVHHLVCACVLTYLSVYPPTCLPSSLPPCLLTCLATYPLTCLSSFLSLSTCLTTYQFPNLSTWQSVSSYLSTYLSTCLSTNQSTCRSSKPIYLSPYLPAYLSTDKLLFFSFQFICVALLTTDIVRKKYYLNL